MHYCDWILRPTNEESAGIVKINTLTRESSKLIISVCYKHYPTSYCSMNHIDVVGCEW